ncbi:MAG TPA: ABC transporter permease [Verrucomicrobiae bacterium]|nr:ABC transporter permease [Verrucomicrobiae bacterium]
MKFFDYIRFALKNIWRQKLRTLLTIFAVIIGATSVVVMLSLVFGAKNALLAQIASSGALTQVNVLSDTDTSNADIFGSSGGQNSGTKLDDTFATKLKAIPHVQSVTPQIGVWAFNKIKLKDGGTEFKFDRGVTAYVPSASADKKLAAGRNLTTDDGVGKIVLSGSYLKKLGFEDNAAGMVGKKVILITQKGFMGAGADIPEPKVGANGQFNDSKESRDEQGSRVTEIEAEVIGVTQAGGFDESSYVSLSWGRALNTWQNWQQDPEDMIRYQKEMDALNKSGNAGPPKLPSKPVAWKLMGEDPITRDGYQQFVLKVDDVENVEAVATEVRKLNVGAVTAKDTLDTILKSFQIVTVVLGIIGAISLFVAAIGVINTMVMATLERTREIGVMRACGATRSAVRRLFTFEAALLGFWGGVFGVLVGVGVGKLANIYAADLLSGAGVGDIIQVPLWLGVSVIGVTTVIGMLAGMYPAIRASRMNPVEALRYE